RMVSLRTRTSFKCNFLLVDSNVLKFQAELFVRGHDIPWASQNVAWHRIWTTFHPLSEEEAFRVGIDFYNCCLRRLPTKDSVESTRMLIMNRLPNLCFTRDRLLFYELQQLAAKRAKWRHQDFHFEAAYYLNF